MQIKTTERYYYIPNRMLKLSKQEKKNNPKPKNTEVGSLSLLQGIFLTQELNQGLLHLQADSLTVELPGKALYIICMYMCVWCVCVCVCVCVYVSVYVCMYECACVSVYL